MCTVHQTWQLPDGVRTNGVVAEVPGFPLMNVRGQMWATCDSIWQQHDATCGNLWQHVATCAHLNQTMSTCMDYGFVALLWKPRLSRPRLEAGDRWRLQSATTMTGARLVFKANQPAASQPAARSQPASRQAATNLVAAPPAHPGRHPNTAWDCSTKQSLASGRDSWETYFDRVRWWAVLLG